jgi:hypothetical protein
MPRLLSIRATLMPETKAYGNCVFGGKKARAVSLRLQAADHICYLLSGCSLRIPVGTHPANGQNRR